jgi:hypothetical protein
MPSFSSKQVVTMVVAVSAAVVLAPVGVLAATGQLVNIVDPVLGDRKVRVGSGGTLQVESRAGATSGAFNKSFTFQGLGYHKIAEVTGPTRIAITEVTLSGYEVDYDAEAALVVYTQTTGTGTCGNTITGYTKTELRRFSWPMHQVTQLQFNGPPLVIPAAAAGKKQCVGFAMQEVGTNARLFLGATGFTYV